MDRRLLDYLPPVLQEVLEFQTINNANEPEIALAWDSLALVLANQFIESADAHGVSVWEQELNIHPKDTDSLSLRKSRIKAMWNLELPYTITWLKNWLGDICGKDGFEVELSDYTLIIRFDYAKIPDTENLGKEVLRILSAIRPANIRLRLLSEYSESLATVYVGCKTECLSFTEVWPES